MNFKEIVDYNSANKYIISRLGEGFMLHGDSCRGTLNFQNPAEKIHSTFTKLGNPKYYEDVIINLLQDEENKPRIPFSSLKTKFKENFLDEEHRLEIYQGVARGRCENILVDDGYAYLGDIAKEYNPQYEKMLGLLLFTNYSVQHMDKEYLRNISKKDLKKLNKEGLDKDQTSKTFKTQIINTIENIISSNNFDDDPVIFFEPLGYRSYEAYEFIIPKLLTETKNLLLENL